MFSCFLGEMLHSVTLSNARAAKKKHETLLSLICVSKYSLLALLNHRYAHYLTLYSPHTGIFPTIVNKGACDNH